MAFRHGKMARLAAGAAIVTAAGTTAWVAMADTAPSGSYGGYSSYSGGTTKAGHGGGYEVEGEGYGQARGHRLHCPSYRGMEESKGHAQCHMAPRHEGVEGTSQATSETPEADEQPTTQNATATKHTDDDEAHATSTTSTTAGTKATADDEDMTSQRSAETEAEHSSQTTTSTTVKSDGSWSDNSSVRSTNRSQANHSGDDSTRRSDDGSRSSSDRSSD